MNKLPAKQIYLLVIIIVGIIALSIYSTFAIFTFDSQTKEAISINLPSTLEIDSNIYEYKQLEIEPNSNKIADIDIYNTFDYDLCYSIWYKNIKDQDIEIYELSENNLTTSGIIKAGENNRVRLLLINNHDKKTYVNIGLATAKEAETCELNLSKDKKIIKSYYGKNIAYFNEAVVSKVTDIKNETENNYITEKDITKKETLKSDTELYKNFELTNNNFKLTNKYEDKIFNFENNKYYLCYNEECKIIYEISEANYNTDGELEITKYNKLTFYEKGTSGLKKAVNNYYYYGSNPDNYIYYNCTKDNCELWRIVGAFYNETTDNYNIKIVRNDYLNKEKYNDNDVNEWINSSLYNYLNKEYQITDLYKLYQDNYKYSYDKVLNTDNYNISSLVTPEPSKVSILTMTDYLNASICTNNSIECINNNWLNKKDNNREWLLATYDEVSISEEEPYEETTSYKVMTVGNTFEVLNPTDKNYYRPVIYLKNRVLLLSGNGTIDNPYMIN